MIADLDETLRQLLIAELPIHNGEIDISFDQPRRDWSTRIAKPTINLFLYDVRENNVLRRHQWERLEDAVSNGDRLARLKRSPMRVDCSYMMTAWAADPADEHRLLTQAMLVLFRFPVIPKSRLIGSLQNPPYDIQARVARHDVLTDPSDLWNVLDNEIRPSVSYVVTLALSPWQEITGPLVRTRILRLGEAQHLPEEQMLLPDESRPDLVLIAGVVREKATGNPASGIPVALKGTGYVATTDESGRFTLGSIAPGTYTLVTWPRSGPLHERQVTIPSESYDLEV